MSGKFIKYITRDYSLRDRSFIIGALVKKGIIEDIYFTKIIDHSNNGMVDIYVFPEDIENMHKRLQRSMDKDKNFIDDNLAKGVQVTNELLGVCKVIPKKIENSEAIGLLERVEDVWQRFSSFIEFTHRIGNMDINLNDRQLKGLEEFHNYRKEVFLKFFGYLDEICLLITSNMEVDEKKLRSLTLSEIRACIDGQISTEQINLLQERRSFEYVYENGAEGERVIDMDVDVYFKKFKEEQVDDEEIGELKGVAITKGRAVGEIIVVTQADYKNKNIEGKILVTGMTTPSMDYLLKNSKAIITEEGGLLCHAAIVAREFGIITLTQVKNATKILHDGDLVEVDADKGIVKILTESPK